MDPRVSRLVKGDRLEREKVLRDADCEFLDELIGMIMRGKKTRYTVDERHDIAVFNEGYDNCIVDLRASGISLSQKMKILKDNGSYFIHKLLKPLIKQKRKRKDCPVPGCTSLGLLHLPNHLNNVHRYKEKDRKFWLSIARLQKAGVSTKEVISRQDGQHTSHDYSRWYKPRNGFEQSCTIGTQAEKQEESTSGFYAPKVAARCSTASTQKEETRDNDPGQHSTAGRHEPHAGSFDEPNDAGEWYEIQRIRKACDERDRETRSSEDRTREACDERREGCSSEDRIREACDERRERCSSEDRTRDACGERRDRHSSRETGDNTQRNTTTEHTDNGMDQRYARDTDR